MKSINNYGKQYVKIPLAAQILVLKAERDAWISVFGGYATDRLRVLEHMIPELERQVEAFDET